MVKVSIIVPVYNAEDSIEKCVNSILTQTFLDYELLLINDGSQDKSLDIIKGFENNPKVKVIDQKNKGVAYTRNLGIGKSRGKYIMFIDNDDYIDEDYVERHVTCIEKVDADVVMSGYRRVDENLKILHEERLKDTYWSRYIIMAPWAKIYRKSYLQKNQIEFFSYGIGEDVYFNLSIMAYNPKTFIMGYVGYNWFFNRKSVSNTSQRGLKKDIDILVLLEKILDKYEEIDDYLAYYLVRYYIWYLLFSGRGANRKDFILEYKRIKEWYQNRGISCKIGLGSKKIEGESLKNRLIVIIFRLIEKLHLMKLFSIVYCKG